MKSTTPVRHTLRFRRWSRKAYAAFASIGHCVTIGCLRKSVADCSLSKQKAASAAGNASCSENCAWEGITQRKEPETNLQIFLETQVIRPYVHTDEEERYIQKNRNNISMDYQNSSSTFIRLLHLDNPCFFYERKPYDINSHSKG